MRSKSSDAIKTTLAEEVASYSSLEDEWDGTVKEKANKTVVCIAIALLVALIGGGAWAFWKLRQHDAVANKAEVDALKVDFIQKLERQKEGYCRD